MAQARRTSCRKEKGAVRAQGLCQEAHSKGQEAGADHKSHHGDHDKIQQDPVKGKAVKMIQHHRKGKELDGKAHRKSLPEAVKPAPV